MGMNLNENEQLIAYIATLAALVIIYGTALHVMAVYPAVLNKTEALALGTVAGGLIGALRFPSARNVAADTAMSDQMAPASAPQGNAP